jgi:hypothetical protein
MLEFWLEYAEPLRAFLEAATLFSETLQNLDAGILSGDDADVAEHRRREAHRALFSFLVGCTPGLTDQRTGGGRMRAFHSKSLLASLAMIAYLDLTSGKHVLRCDEDGRPFVSGAYQARYCSDRCRKHRRQARVSGAPPRSRRRRECRTHLGPCAAAAGSTRAGTWAACCWCCP